MSLWGKITTLNLFPPPPEESMVRDSEGGEESGLRLVDVLLVYGQMINLSPDPYRKLQAMPVIQM